MMLPVSPTFTYAPDIRIFETELTVLLLLSMEHLGLTPQKKAVFFSYVGVKQIVLRHCLLKETGGYCVTKDSQVLDVLSGPEMSSF